MSSIELTAADGHRISAYRADPEGAPRACVVIVQEIFGVNGHIRDVTDRYAREGYLAIAPALFDRIEPGIELEYDADGLERGKDLVARLDPGAILADLSAAVAVGRGEELAVAMVGYCFGGAVVWVAAHELPELACVVSYYGSRIQRYAHLDPKVPTMLHVGRFDASFPMKAVEEITAAHPSVVVHDYDAGHGFNCDRRDDFRRAAAKLALDRTLAFVAEHAGLTVGAEARRADSRFAMMPSRGPSSSAASSRRAAPRSPRSATSRPAARTTRAAAGAGLRLHRRLTTLLSLLRLALVDDSADAPVAGGRFWG